MGRMLRSFQESSLNPPSQLQRGLVAHAFNTRRQKDLWEFKTSLIYI